MKLPIRPVARLVNGRCWVRPLAVRRFATAQTSAAASASTNASSSSASSSAPNDRVNIIEVGPRDGLQNEKATIPLSTKIELIERLARAGLATIEAGSFVAPKWVPQMSNSADILEHILQHRIASPRPISYAFLVPNMKGMDQATVILQQYPDAFLAEPAPTPASTTSSSSNGGDDNTTSPTSSFKPAVELAIFAAATESFSQKNLNCDIATSLERFRPVIQAAKNAAAASAGTDTGAGAVALPPLRVRAYISVVLGCPFEGPDVDPRRVAALATDLLEMGADTIALGDTTGMGTAPRTKELLRCVTAAGIRHEDVGLHFHDTYGQALVNTAVGLEHGIRTFDSAVGGLGGCPYSPGATGNVATENLVYFLESLGMDTGVDLDAVADIGAWVTSALGKAHDSSVGKAVLGARTRVAAKGP
ncbi:hydroxymethylglutaryl-lyase [Niveomyces insectorum RCEF 264]|uniref:hydroxymethylglutaryl-CoA lyase n=1 Tax=Niveomyces insectorum RCEF 264 TaxID=1081102 RepID=A0A167NPK0_9HYPO|nr:hydroxymethylglutaryl-lyase [Niveomyces insectorum RCEF 264]